MIRVLDVKDDERFRDKEYVDFNDFVNALSHTYYITDVGVTKDETVGYVYLEDKINYTNKTYIWFEDVNIINPRKYQKYL